MGQRETEITRAIRHCLDVLGIEHWKNFGGPLSKKGVADILGIMPKTFDGQAGKFLAIEVKTPRGRLSKQQADFLNMIARNDGIAMVATSVDDVIDKLNVRDRFLF